MKHTGHCHCKKVEFETELDLTNPVVECNCSHCAMKGLLLQFVPRDSFTLTKGEEDLTEYRFNTEKIAHHSCSTCGVEPFAYGSMPDGSPIVAINIRTLDEIDLDALTRQPFNGKDM